MPVFAAVKGSQNGFEVRRIYCVGRNYLDHIREMKEADERDPPFFFQKPTDSLVADGATVAYPAATTDFQFEVELVVAIAKAGRDVAVDAAAKHIFGYAIGIDFTRRDLQREARDRAWPWEMGKSFDQSAPCGPLHPIAGTGEITKGAISLSVNGAQKQKGDIAQMIWNVAEIIANLSKQYKLEPGDLIYTGTPAGVGPVVPGDKIDCAIDGLGTLRIGVGPAATA
jgi:fumarylpyruvate hydrolase